MNDDELLEQFEAASIPGDCFPHAEHLRAAFLYLCRYPLLEALQKFSDALRRLAGVNGKPERYHETITWAYVFLVHERMQEDNWEGFASRNPDLLDWRNSILKTYYREETLASAKARRQFVLPDRGV